MDNQLRVTVVGLNELIEVTAHGEKAVQASVKTAMQKAVLLVEGNAKALASQRGLGSFVRTIHSKVTGIGGTTRGVVGTNDRRGRWFEFGTGVFHEGDPHKPWTVTAVNRFALTIKVGAGTPGSSEQWAVKGSGPFQYARMSDAKGRALFRTPKGGSTFKPGGAQNVIFRKKVTIKGMKPRHWLRLALQRDRPKIELIFRQALSDVNHSLAEATRKGGVRR